MFHRTKFILVGAVLVLALFCAAGCAPGLRGDPVSLEPDDPRPVLSVQVADPDEAALLVQELELEIVKMEGGRLFFFESPGQLSRLADLGYFPQKQDVYSVFKRVARIDRKVTEADLKESGIELINREENSYVVRGTIGQLRQLQERGVKIVALRAHEPRPRQIRILVDSPADVAKIGAMQIDIYNAKRDPRGNRKSIVVHGGAFDYQIDELEAAGYKVEILPDPGPKKKGGGQ